MCVSIFLALSLTMAAIARPLSLTCPTVLLQWFLMSSNLKNEPSEAAKVTRRDDHADIIEWKLADGCEMGMFSSDPQQTFVLVYLKLTLSFRKHFREVFHHMHLKLHPKHEEEI